MFQKAPQHPLDEHSKPETVPIAVGTPEGSRTEIPPKVVPSGSQMKPVQKTPPSGDSPELPVEEKQPSVQPVDEYYGIDSNVEPEAPSSFLWPHPDPDEVRESLVNRIDRTASRGFNFVPRFSKFLEA